jgi:phospholipase C
MAKKNKNSGQTKKQNTTPGGGLSNINHFVVLMLENRSFDQLLGFLYTNAPTPNQSPLGHPYEGLTGAESNLTSQGKPFPVFEIPANDKNLFFYPKADPGEGFHNTNAQLFGTTSPAAGAQADNSGFIKNFGATLAWQKGQKNGHWDILPGTQETDIMGMYTPDQLPVLSGLAKGYAVCDHWYSSAPTETLPNRAFALMATSQGFLDDANKVYTAKSIFTLLADNQLTWAVYGYTSPPLTRNSVADITQASNGNFGLFKDFQAAVSSGNLANFVFLEPSWDAQGNSQHPVGSLAAGDAFIQQVYQTLYGSKVWEDTLLIITYDEHGGNYDHVPPPTTAVAPDNSNGEFGFDFQRFGVRVPAVLVSPYIEAGTVYRVTQGIGGAPTPFDHTSILKTVEKRFGLQPLTKRDAAAPDLGGVLTLSTTRTDDPLARVKAQAGPAKSPIPDHPTHLQQVQAHYLSRLPVAGKTLGVEHHENTAPKFKSGSQADAYIKKRYKQVKF